ncbi:MAG: hypothetical protein JWM02_3050 [Frankiales bacterium]|nr:hypothetical protein [Frankiales bacterium]
MPPCTIVQAAGKPAVEIAGDEADSKLGKPAAADLTSGDRRKLLSSLYRTPLADLGSVRLNKYDRIGGVINEYTPAA